MSGWSTLRLDEARDMTGDGPGEFRMLARRLGAEQVSLTYRRLPPGAEHFPVPGHGHRHRTQEEVYFVVSGRVRFRLDDEEVEVGPLTAVRVSAPVARDLRNESAEDAELLIVSTRVEDLREETEVVPDLWPAESPAG